MVSTVKQFAEILHDWTETFMHRSFRDFKCFMDACGLSPSQINALMQLYHGRACGVSDIGSHMGISKAAASQMIDHLVQMGLLERTENPDDRRAKQITLTTQGCALMEKGVEARSHWMEQLGQVLTESQQAEICSALTQLIQAARQLENN